MMKKTLLTVALFGLFGLTTHAQGVLFFDASVPNGGPKYNIGGRMALFSPLDPNLQYGMTVRAHRLDLERAEQPGTTATFHELSVGFGLRYLFVKTPDNSFYLNPNFELNSFDEDEGMDLSFNLGYIKRLSKIINLNVEAGVRSRMAGYGSQQALNDRTSFYLSAGFGFQLPRLFGAPDPVLDGK